MCDVFSYDLNGLPWPKSFWKGIILDVWFVMCNRQSGICIVLYAMCTRQKYFERGKLPGKYQTLVFLFVS